MKADYSRIADRYDRTRARVDADVDPILLKMVRNSAAGGFSALDVGCGTGNYLRIQIENGPPSVTWEGMDPSADMLCIAREKLPNRVSLTLGTAEQLPYEDSTFDFVALQAVFHHFPDKERALTEIDRVLKPGGWMHIRNGAFEHRERFWVYRFFPATWEIDKARFWTVDRLFDALVRRAYEPHAAIHHTKYFETKQEVMRWAENRDLSQLNLLDDEAYRSGLQALRDDAAQTVLTELATLDLSARKPSRP